MPNKALAHNRCSGNSDELKNSEKCGCFYCLQIFTPEKITKLVDGGKTALCPFCGVDSVIGDASGFPITKEFLSDVKKEWFR